MVRSKLSCRKNESLRLLGASLPPGTCIFRGWALGDHRGGRRSAPHPKPNPRLSPFSSTPALSPAHPASLLCLWFFLFFPLPSILICVSFLTLTIFLYSKERRGDWLVQLELRGPGPWYRSSGVCKAGLIPSNAALNVSKEIVCHIAPTPSL